jgi:hypothetical protein
MSGERLGLRSEACCGGLTAKSGLQCSLIAFALCAGAMVLTGCVRRTLTVNTDPQGAAVVLNDQHIGTSPAKVDFVWYGDYSVILHKDGYETVNTHYRIKPPWYENPPIDLFAEAFTPWWYHDQQEMMFSLEPAKPVDRKQLLDQAQEFRDRALYESEKGPATRPASRPAK